MLAIFCGCWTFNQPLNDWKILNVRNMQAMFNNCKKFNQPLDKWGAYTANVDEFSFMFANTDSFNQDLRRWNINKYSNHTDMFKYSAIEYKNLPYYF